MELIDDVAAFRSRLNAARADGQRIGMVGTSGAVHAGHLSLVERAAAENDLTAVYWGGTPSDLGWRTQQLGYERDATRDFPLIEAAGCDVLFTPPGKALYVRPPMTNVTVPQMSRDIPRLEDPAHLDLIAMMMCKLWNIFGPCRNYSGEKDWQQLVMFQRVAEDLWFPVEVIGCPTVREPDGLPVSSRNGKLTPEQRATAPVIHRALRACDDAVRTGTRRADQLEKVFTETIGDTAEIVYFVAVEADSMQPLDELVGAVRLLASIELGGVRILDNIGVEALQGG